MINCEAYIVKNEIYGLNCHRLTLAVPYYSKISAGQFVHIFVDKTTSPLLRRPFSIYSIEYFDNALTNIDILFTIVGKGTKILAQKKPLDTVDFLGPLGNGYTIARNAKAIILVAGGIGIAPFYTFAKQLIKQKFDRELVLLFGAKTRQELYGLSDFEKLGLTILTSTEDGSYGKKGVVTALLEDYLKQLFRRNIKKVQLYVCGPEPMLDKVVKIAKKNNLSCEVSLEKRMACGLGACGACVTKVISNKGHFSYSKICVEGPVYNAYNLII